MLILFWFTLTESLLYLTHHYICCRIQLAERTAVAGVRTSLPLFHSQGKCCCAYFCGSCKVIGESWWTYLSLCITQRVVLQCLYYGIVYSNYYCTFWSHTHTHACAHTHTHTHAYMSMHAHTHTHTHMSMHAHTHTHTHTHMHACTHTCMHARHAHTHTLTHSQTLISTCALLPVHSL